MAEPLAALLALALAVAPVPSVSPTATASDGDRAPAEASEPALRVAEGPAEAPTVDVAPGGQCYGSRPCKRLVVLASVTGGLGLTAIIVGGVLAAKPQRIDPDDPTRAIAYRPAGSAALAIGLGVLATGLLMTLAAVRASRHAKKGAATAHLRPSGQRQWSPAR